MKNNDFVMKVGESLVAGGPPGTAAEPEVVVGRLNGPFGTEFIGKSNKRPYKSSSHNEYRRNGQTPYFNGK